MKTRAFNQIQQMKVVVYQDGKPIFKNKGTPNKVKKNTKSFFDEKY